MDISRAFFTREGERRVASPASLQVLGMAEEKGSGVEAEACCAAVVPCAETVLCSVPLRVCPKVSKLCNFASALLSKRKGKVSKCFLSPPSRQCFGVTIAKLHSPQWF